LEDRIASLKQVIARHDADLRNTASEERKDRIRYFIKTGTWTLNPYNYDIAFSLSTFFLLKL
jgi:hypothetical protein